MACKATAGLLSWLKNPGPETIGPPQLENNDNDHRSHPDPLPPHRPGHHHAGPRPVPDRRRLPPRGALSQAGARWPGLPDHPAAPGLLPHRPGLCPRSGPGGGHDAAGGLARRHHREPLQPPGPRRRGAEHHPDRGELGDRHPHHAADRQPVAALLHGRRPDHPAAVRQGAAGVRHRPGPGGHRHARAAPAADRGGSAAEAGEDPLGAAAGGDHPAGPDQGLADLRDLRPHRWRWPP